MARPEKNGIEYFPKDTGFYRDRKIRAVLARFGGDGTALYDYILCEIYDDKGYYLQIDDDFQDIASADLYVSYEKIGLMLDFLLKKSLFDNTLFSRDKVLSSHGIQTRYQKAVKSRGAKRDIVVDGKFWLLDEAETESFIKVQINANKSEKNIGKSEKNPSYSEEQSLKESKGKESTLLPQPANGGGDEKTDFEKKAIQSAEYMAKKILAHTPNFPHLKDGLKEKTTRRWAQDIEKLLRIDGADLDEFKRVLKFSQTDPFWQQNILSGRKLREQYGALLVRLQEAE